MYLEYGGSRKLAPHGRHVLTKDLAYNINICMTEKQYHFITRHIFIKILKCYEVWHNKITANKLYSYKGHKDIRSR